MIRMKTARAMSKNLEPEESKTRGNSSQIDPLPDRTLYLILVLVCLICYRTMLDNGLFNDDYSWLRAARYEMRPSNVLFFRVVDFFRPLVNLSFWAMEKAAPGNIKLHYALNIVLHAVCTVLVFKLLRLFSISRGASFAASFLFAVTSVHCAAVMWISARTTLLSAAFLLAAFVVLSSRPASLSRLSLSCILYTLSLASKEEAIAGLPLAAAMFLLSKRHREQETIAPKPAILCWACISAVYIAVRTSSLGGLLRENWNIGVHAIRNLCGGFLYQFYPWPFFSIFYPRGSAIAESSSSVMPELIALPLAVLLLLAAREIRRSYAMNIALSWSAISLLPASFFRYRFFSTESISQNRYYYLSSVGTTLAIALLVSSVWGASVRRRAAAVALFAFLACGYFVRIQRLERKWEDYTRYNARIVEAIVEESDSRSHLASVAVESPPIAPKYLADAFALARPERTLFAVSDSLEAANRAPCLYISFSGEAPKVMRITAIE